MSQTLHRLTHKIQHTLSNIRGLLQTNDISELNRIRANVRSVNNMEDIRMRMILEDDALEAGGVLVDDVRLGMKLLDRRKRRDFSRVLLPTEIDAKQISNVKEFRKMCEAKGVPVAHVDSGKNLGLARKAVNFLVSKRVVPYVTGRDVKQFGAERGMKVVLVDAGFPFGERFGELAAVCAGFNITTVVLPEAVEEQCTGLSALRRSAASTETLDLYQTSNPHAFITGLKSQGFTVVSGPHPPTDPNTAPLDTVPPIPYDQRTVFIIGGAAPSPLAVHADVKITSPYGKHGVSLPPVAAASAMFRLIEEGYEGPNPQPQEEHEAKIRREMAFAKAA